MGLHPLEFSECYLDSPSVREKIKAHEAELDKTNRFIKELYKDGKNLINATKQLGMAQRKFAHCLGEFHFEYIGDAKTDDEKCIDESLQEFSSFLKNLEEQRELMMKNITETLMKPLEKFRKEQLGAVRAERKKYEKETEKYYSSLEKLLNMSAKKKEPQLQEADVQVETVRQHFQEESLDYVCKLQEIQERKKFDCVEPMLAFFQTVFTFYHQGYELAKDFDHYKRALQINIQNTRNRFEGTRSQVYELKKRIREAPQEYRQTSPISFEGYLYVQEKHEKSNEVDLSASEEWDIKTITSALKLYLRSLPEPLMTYGLYKEFINPAKGGSPESRIQAVHCLVHKLPERNRQVLGLLMKHLANVAAHSKMNLMTVANLGVVFGPTLMRPQEETVAAIMDLKFQNIVVEILIEHHEKIFTDAPDLSPLSPVGPVFSAPTRQSKKQSRQNRPLAVYNPQVLDIQNAIVDGSNLMADETSMGSNESVSSQSSSASASELPAEKDDLTTLTASFSSGSNSRCPPVASSGAPGESQPAATTAASEKEKQEQSVTGRKAKAVYPCEAEHDSELSFQVGAIFSAVTQSREPGWLEGELEGRRGLIPENYVEML
ncbi:rho GTPase-activating protein 10 [Nematolebias whitei]|uniref:rho GTPase-activating protein 10 n=1 Tax=Nematolebias whitei TaxID=451745 RepID=UPI001898B580|nr:rho GTPase-activating protein 10 [Nematolebias whitei]